MNWGIKNWGAMLAVAGGMVAFAQPSFDSSGDGNLEGNYFVREILLSDIDQTTGAVGRALSLSGVMTFDGAGNYSFSGQLMDSKAGQPQTITGQTGVYGLAANGIFVVLDVIDTSQYNFGEAAVPGSAGVPAALLASATEGPHRNLFVAVPAGGSISNASVKGSYNAAFIDFLQGNASLVRDGYFTLTTSGNGSFGSVTVSGAMANVGSENTTQNLASVTYNITNDAGSGTITFPPLPSLATLITGQKTLYVSADGILLAGNPQGYDMLIGIPALTSGAANSLFEGTYFIAGLENNVTRLGSGMNNEDALSGSIFSLGDGTTTSHLRLAESNSNAIDYTYAPTYSVTPGGTFDQGLIHCILGLDGEALLEVGTGTYYSLTPGFTAGVYTGQGPFVDPLKVWNAASLAPITNSVAPGEFVSLFGSGLAPSAMGAPSLPLPTMLNGVEVAVNGVAAPISYVGPNQINVLVPYSTSGGYATFEVSNNGNLSNVVTLYQAPTAPGVFTSTAGFDPGTGPAAALHAGYSTVTKSNPAKVGETLQLYMAGLGAVTPAVADGTEAPSSPLSMVDTDVGVFVDGQSATVTFKGLAPGFAGLYQVNFVVPKGVASGQLVNLAVSTPDGFTMEAKLYVQ